MTKYLIYRHLLLLKLLKSVTLVETFKQKIFKILDLSQNTIILAAIFMFIIFQINTYYMNHFLGLQKCRHLKKS